MVLTLGGGHFGQRPDLGSIVSGGGSVLGWRGVRAAGALSPRLICRVLGAQIPVADGRGAEGAGGGG